MRRGTEDRYQDRGVWTVELTDEGIGEGGRRGKRRKEEEKKKKKTTKAKDRGPRRQGRPANRKQHGVEGGHESRREEW